MDQGPESLPKQLATLHDGKDANIGLALDSDSSAGRHPPFTGKLERALDEARKDAGITGAADALVLSGGKSWVGTSGMSDPGRSAQSDNGDSV